MLPQTYVTVVAVSGHSVDVWHFVPEVIPCLLKIAAGHGGVQKAQQRPSPVPRTTRTLPSGMVLVVSMHTHAWVPAATFPDAVGARCRRHPRNLPWNVPPRAKRAQPCSLATVPPPGITEGRGVRGNALVAHPSASLVCRGRSSCRGRANTSDVRNRVMRHVTLVRDVPVAWLPAAARTVHGHPSIQPQRQIDGKRRHGRKI